MNTEARQIVQAGLDRRKAAAREARLDAYEQDQIRFCNANCADARMLRQAEEATRLTIQKAEARRVERHKESARKQALEDKTMAAVRYYACGCLAIMLMVAVTRFPIWAAIALALGLGVFPAAYIFRLYYPAEE